MINGCDITDALDGVESSKGKSHRMKTSHEFYHHLTSHIRAETREIEEGTSVSVASTEIKCRQNENLSQILSPSDISHSRREKGE